MFFIRLLSRLPLSIHYKISDFLFFVSFYLVRYRRRLVATNLAHSFPEKTPAQRQEIERDFYKHLCDYAVESLKLVTMSKEELRRRMVFTDPDVPRRFKEANQSILFLASHQFNWEWLLVSASINFPMAIDFVYQPVNNKFFNALILEIRSRFGAHPIKRDEVARELVRRKHLLRGVATVADQYPGYGRDKKFIAQFLNRETAFFMGTNQLALLTQYPAIYYGPKRISRGYYQASPVIIALPPYPKDSMIVIAKYVQEVEDDIKEDPSGWLWSHNRWKKRHLRKSSGDNINTSTH